MSKCLSVGITGGIGSGKSVVSNYVKSLGFPVLYADDIAKKIMTEDAVIKENLIGLLGESSYENGKLNSEFIADSVFSDESKLKELNAIVHPAVITQIKNDLQQLNKENHFVFVEAALIFESKMQSIFDYVILITSDDEVKIDRVCKRDNISAEKVKMRMKNQWDDVTKQENTDFTLVNNGSEKELLVKVDFILRVLTSISIS